MSHNLRKHSPTIIEKWLMVLYKKYPSVSAIPHSVEESMVKMVLQRARVHGSMLLMAGTAMACFFMAWSGKRAAERGESVERMNIEWHKQEQAKMK